ncbi:MAG: hypothetical protein AAF266_02215 [Planctomycetota bacterium]
MALALTALAVATLTRIAANGLALVLESRTLHDQLQDEWAVLSCRQALLDNAEQLMADSDTVSAELGWPHPSERAASFQMGGITYQAVLFDEQAKLNLNLAYELEPSLIASLLAEAQQDFSVPLQRGAILPPLKVDGAEREYRSWGELIDLPRLARGERAGERLVGFAGRFTVSDDKRLNVRRASDTVLRGTAGLFLSTAEAEELVERRRGHNGELRGWLDSTDIPSRRLLKLRRYLTDRSAAYSLWIWNTTDQEVTMASAGLSRGRRHPQVLKWP